MKFTEPIPRSASTLKIGNGRYIGTAVPIGVVTLWRLQEKAARSAAFEIPKQVCRRLLARKSGWRCALVATVICTGAYMPATAVASTEYAPNGSFGEEGTGSGQMLAPRGVAVDDSTGNVYVADRGNARTDEFSSSGTFIRAWGWEVDGLPGFGECMLSCVSGAPGSGAGQFREPGAVAVDNSSGSSADDVYVSDPENHRVEKFSSEGVYIAELTGVCEHDGEVAIKLNACPTSTTKEALPFRGIHGIAVGPAGNLWVYDQSANEQGQIDEFDDDGRFLGDFSTNENAAERSADLAIDSRGDIFVPEHAEEAVLEFDSSGTRIGGLFDSFAVGLAANTSTNNLIVAQRTSRFRGGDIQLYPPFAEPRTPIQTFPSEAEEPDLSQGIAVNDVTASLYATVGFEGEGNSKIEMFNLATFPTVATEVASEAAEDSVTLHGSIAPEGEAVSSCEFEYGTAEAEPGAYPSHQPCTPVAPFAGTEALISVSARLTGLEPHQIYHYRLTAENHNGRRSGQDATTFTSTPPRIGTEAVSGASTDGVSLHANIDPAGLVTEYYVEYGTSEAYGLRTSGQEISAATEPASVIVALHGLQPDTGYDVRFIARNDAGISAGKNFAFSTSSPGETASSTLPDRRTYELVSTGGVEVYTSGTPFILKGLNTLTHLPMQAASDGDAVAYAGEPSSTGGNGAVGEAQGDDWLAIRGADGWKAEVTTPFGSGPESVFEAFSEDLSTGFLVTKVEPPLATGAPVCNQGNGESDLYRRDNATGTYSPLFTTTETPEECGHPAFAGTTADESQIIFQDQAALTENSQRATEVPPHQVDGLVGHSSGGIETGEPCEFGCDLYDSTEAGLRLVNILPSGQVAASANFGGFSRTHRPDFEGAISQDGSRIFWTDTQEGPDMEHVFVQESGTSEIQVSGASRAEYWTATPDGHYAYYTEDGALWRFNTQDNTREPMVDENLNGGNPEVQGVVGINTAGEGGSYVYFVANGVLTDVPNRSGKYPVLGDCDEADEPGGAGCNLYVRHAQSIQFVATLSREDDRLNLGRREAGGDWSPGMFERTSEVTPDGRHVLFTSVNSLTGYDNTDSSGRIAEAFVYAAATEQVSCASCDPQVAATPLPIEEASSVLPIGGSNTHLLHWMSDDGEHVFFETSEPLVTTDINGVGDLYEWEQEGTASCPVATSLYGGCVFLLSGGQNPTPSTFVDASASGGDVFFTSRAQLVPEDRDEKTDLYDAHECSESVPCIHESKTACAGAGCQGVPPAAPSFAIPASATFNGVGNFLAPLPAKSKVKPKSLTKAQKLAEALRRCRKDKVKRKRVSCERQARKRYGAPATRKATNNRKRRIGR